MMNATANETSSMLLVGLGNPGSKYTHTRHNAGFDVIDQLLKRWKIDKVQSKFGGLFSLHGQGEQRLYLLKPQTFMNSSGRSVGEAVTFYKIPIPNLLVISDDLDLPPGALRLRTGGGPGGHNGLKSIIETLGGEAFPRLRIGIGRSDKMDAEDYVLAKIPDAERENYFVTIQKAADAVECIVREGVVKAMNTVNKKESKT